ncbi:MAG: hypothetical protein H7Y15_15940 [Pseudonocardia sp.]|nr:hypothetical protein [Pseudonocardia sp.]
MRELLVTLNEAGTTVVLSSHLLSEVEALCTRVGVMDAGRLVLTEDLATLRTPTGFVTVHTSDPRRAASIVGGRIDGDVLVVRAVDPADVNARLVAAGVAVTRLNAQRRSLEQVVLELTGSGSDRVGRP